jgi:quaternary ammonium compound-resistance protein SugE
MPLAWMALAAAGLLEIVWMYFMKASDGFSRPLPSIGFGLSSFASFWLLSYAVRTIPMGTGYAVWTGIGAVGAAIMGILIYKEPATLARLLCILLIIAGIAGLKLQSSGA